MVYDTIIIGTGPAGLSAALNLKIHGKNILWIGSKELSSKVGKAEEILNYPGIPRVTGKELNEAFLKHIEDMDLTISEYMVNGIQKFGKNYAVMAESDFYEAKTVLLCTGVATVGTLPGEEDLVGKGVSYCATCDGSLYKGKNIGIICKSARFEHEVSYLANIAEKVYYFPLYKDNSVEADNIIKQTEKPVKINEKDGRVSSITLKNGEEIFVDGVFCLRESVSLNTLLPKLETENGHIVVNRKMETNLSGCYAAGDCTGRPYQYTKAVGEGNIAAHSIISYLAELDNK
ncbi:MAG: NAD(P)/FAD-dependent oxidoreductase [Intestinibacter sp.]|uniref:NAD(P)/FAD-dependent oxidoreductase n=1 Tax=Intestinibacter sp. TaxID=1965304 RepID=UPI003F189ACA